MVKVYEFQVIKDDDGSKNVVYENGEKRFIDKDSNNKEFFYVPNFYTDHKFKLFIGRIKDAIDTIRNGNGDALVVKNIFGKSEGVVRYLDRDYGESLRAKTLDGFKDAEFGYSLKFGYLNSFSGSYFIKKDMTILTFLDNPTDYIFFKTEEEAEGFKEECLRKAQIIANDYSIVKLSKNENEIHDFITKNHVDDIISNLWSAIAEKDEYKFEVVQVLLDNK